MIEEILEEVDYQNSIWGKQNHDDLYWLGILIEEVGETSKALIEYRFDAARNELIDAAAVILSWIDCIDKRKTNERKIQVS